MTERPNDPTTVGDAPAESRPFVRRHAPALGFGIALITLSVAAASGLIFPQRVVTGLPDDPDVAAARALMQGRGPLPSGGLRHCSALAGEASSVETVDGVSPEAAAAADLERIAQAERLLQSARRRHDDPRLLSALGCLDLAANRLERAERRYRAALDRVGHLGEARIGLGVTLAERAELEGNQARARALRLQAIAQFAAVAERDPCHATARHNRALLLERVGRREEARRLSAEG